MAWFHSAPVDKTKPKTRAGADEPTPTRAERITANGGTPLMPSVGDAAYLVGYWQDVGMVAGGGMAPAALTAMELQAWQAGQGIELTPWEFATLRDMSRAYLTQAHESDKPECPPPYGNPAAQVDRVAVSNKMRNLFRAITQAKR